MTKLQFEALKAKYPNRLRCFAMVASPSRIIVFDTLTSTRTTVHEHWTVKDIDRCLSRSNRLPSNAIELKDVNNPVMYTVSDLSESDKWEEL